MNYLRYRIAAKSLPRSYTSNPRSLKRENGNKLEVAHTKFSHSAEFVSEHILQLTIIFVGHYTERIDVIIMLHRVRRFFVLMKAFLLPHFPSIRAARLAHKETSGLKKKYTRSSRSTLFLEIHRTFSFGIFFSPHIWYPAAVRHFSFHVIV